VNLKAAKEESKRVDALKRQYSNIVEYTKEKLLSTQDNATLVKNDGKGNCLIFVGQQIQEKNGIRKTPLQQFRKILVDSVAGLQETWVNEQPDMSHAEKIQTLDSLFKQRIERYRSGVNLGDYGTNAPSDVDAVACLLNGRLKLHNITYDQIRESTIHGDEESPFLPGAILFSNIFDLSYPHFELIELRQGHNVF
jgi:hypothetical protein